MAFSNIKMNQSGSVLVYIMIAVALFAALGMTVSNMMRGGGNVGNEKAGVYASEILGYAKTLREAVQAVKISNACEDTDISFERAPFDGSDALYVNAGAPPDFSCHVFHGDGGGVNYQEDFNHQNWQFSAEFAVANVGTAAPDLVATITIDRSICNTINSRLGVSNAAVEAGTLINDGASAGNVLPAYQGAYTGTSQITASEYTGKMAGCYLGVNGGGENYTFYQVLIPR